MLYSICTSIYIAYSTYIYRTFNTYLIQLVSLQDSCALDFKGIFPFRSQEMLEKKWRTAKEKEQEQGKFRFICALEWSSVQRGVCVTWLKLFEFGVAAAAAAGTRMCHKQQATSIADR